MSLSKILYAFAKQGAGSSELYAAFEGALTNEILAETSYSDLITLSWALVVAGRFEAPVIQAILTMLVGAYDAKNLKLSDAQYEQLLWIKLSLTWELQSD